MISQKENNNWYLTEGIHILFDEGQESYSYQFMQSHLNRDSNESCISISDAGGNFLFYSDGITVWDRNFEISPNGQNLGGYSSTAQSIVAMPTFTDPNQYYLFTLGTIYEGVIGGDLSYSIYDITLNGGKGDILLPFKNIKLAENLTEHMTVAYGGRDSLWVICHKTVGDNFISIPVSKEGIGDAVVSETGHYFVQYTTSSEGKFKYNADRNLVSMCGGFSDNYLTGEFISPAFLELFCFDRNSGKLSSIATIDSSLIGSIIYDSSFSPDGTKLYFDKDYALYQADISDLNLESLTPNFIHQLDFSLGRRIQYELGPDDKLYFRSTNINSINVIHNPNEEWAGINLELKKYELTIDDDVAVQFGFPAPLLLHEDISDSERDVFIQSLDTVSTCNKTFVIYTDDEYHDNNLLWNTGDTSINLEVTESGLYWVSILDGSCSMYIDSIFINLDSTDDKIICIDQIDCEVSIINLSACLDADSYLWSTGESTKLIQPTSSGEFWLEARFSGCVQRDTIVVTFNNQRLDLGNDISSCDLSTPIILRSNIESDNYLWSTGVITNNISVNQPGEYWLEAEIDGCIYRDTININISSYDLNLGDDITLCDQSMQSILQSNVDADNYLWSTGETTEQISIAISGEYWLEVEINECNYRDSINLSILSYDLDLGDDIIQCEQSILTSIPSNVAADSYLWSTGETTPEIEVISSGTYWLETNIDNCIQRDTINVTYDGGELSISTMVQNCLEQIYGLSSNLEAEQYLWSTDEITKDITVQQTNRYWLEVQSGTCTYRDSIDLVLDKLDIDLPRDTVICIGDALSISISDPSLTLQWQDGYIGSPRLLSDAGIYAYTISTGSCDISSVIELRVDECEPSFCNVYVPNAISANAISEENRSLRIYSNCEIDMFQIEIFDRWGNLVHRGTDPEVPWDQMFLGEQITSGVYILKIAYRLATEGDQVEVYRTLSLL